MQKFLDPEITVDTQQFWAGLQREKLLLQCCERCSKLRFPPLPSCPYCGTMGGILTNVEPSGELLTWTKIYRPLDPRLIVEAPFIVTLVRLDCGPRITGRLINYNEADVCAGLRVKGVFIKLDDDLTLLNFEPI